MPPTPDDPPVTPPVHSRRAMEGVPQRSGKAVLAVILALVVAIVTAVVLIGLHRG